MLRLEPGDEEAHVALMARFADAGDRYQALRQYDRLDRTLAPSSASGQDGRPTPSATASWPPRRWRRRPRRCSSGAARSWPPSIWRWTASPPATPRSWCSPVPPGSGKSALLRAAVDRAAERGWRLGSGTVGAADGAWAYAPVLDAVTDLCRRHPTLLDGVADVYRTEIDRVLAGFDAPWDGQSTHQRLFVAVAELLRLAGATTGAVLAIDDVHDADDATIRLLHHLARALTDSRCCCC